MLRPDIYYVAYKNLYANSGASTRGVDNDTADGFGEKKIMKIINMLQTESYEPSPSRRTYVNKANGKKRPLGIPTFTDKLVQEVLRMILQAVYEPVFLDCSHGFRPNRSCHTALKNLKAARSVLLKTPCKSQTDKKIQYIRYADDFILSVNGSREECIEIKKKLSQFISEVLKMQLSDEKTLITHSSNHARFLGYDISVRRNAQIKRKNGGVSLRALNNKVELLIPLKEKINCFMFDKGVIFQKNDSKLNINIVDISSGSRNSIL